jgi:hypothetical protein
VAVMSAGGAVEVHETLMPHHRHHAIHRTVATAPYAPVTAGGTANAEEARRRDAERRMLIPAITGDTVVDPSLAPALDGDVADLGSGGAAAPVEPADSLDPVAPPADDDAVAGDAGDGSATGNSSSTTVPPASGSSSSPSDPPPADPAPPATSAAPPADPAPAAPPASTTVGGATYQTR